MKHLTRTKPPNRSTSARESVLFPVPGRPTIMISMAQSVTIPCGPMTNLRLVVIFSVLLVVPYPAATAAGAATVPNSQSTMSPPSADTSDHPIVLHAARLLDIEAGRIVPPGEVLVQGERIVEAGSSVSHPAGAQTIDLGDSTLMPGLIDAHVHLFLHPGAEDLQTVEESVPQRTIIATVAAREDLMAGFTAERDMGAEGAGSADTGVRNAIGPGLI